MQSDMQELEENEGRTRHVGFPILVKLFQDRKSDFSQTVACDEVGLGEFSVSQKDVDQYRF